MQGDVIMKFFSKVILTALFLFIGVLAPSASYAQGPLVNRWYFTDPNYKTGFEPFDSLTERVVDIHGEHELISKSPSFIYPAICAALDPKSEAWVLEQVIKYYQSITRVDPFQLKRFGELYSNLIAYFREHVQSETFVLPTIKIYGYINDKRGFFYDFDKSILNLRGVITPAHGINCERVVIRFTPPVKSILNPPSDQFVAYGGSHISIPTDETTAETLYHEYQSILGTRGQALWYYIVYTPKYDPETFERDGNAFIMDNNEITLVIFKGEIVFDKNNRVKGFKDLQQLGIYQQ